MKNNVTLNWQGYFICSKSLYTNILKKNILLYKNTEIKFL